MTEEQSREWHLDRKFAVSLIFTILIQSAAIVWWASAISTNVEELKIQDARHDAGISALTAGRESNANRITSLEAAKSSIEGKLGRIEDKLDRLIEAKLPN